MLSFAIKRYHFCYSIVFRKNWRISSNAWNQYTINSWRGSYMARESERVFFRFFISSALSPPSSILSAGASSFSNVPICFTSAAKDSSRIIHFRRKLHVSVPHCATSPSGAFSGTAVRFRWGRKRNRKSQPLQMYAHPK